MKSTCCFIVEGQGRTATFCGKPATKGSYCGEHYAITRISPEDAAKQKARFLDRVRHSSPWTGRTGKKTQKKYGIPNML